MFVNVCKILFAGKQPTENVGDNQHQPGHQEHAEPGGEQCGALQRGGGTQRGQQAGAHSAAHDRDGVHQQQSAASAGEREENHMHISQS